jgi:hypothetical protein
MPALRGKLDSWEACDPRLDRMATAGTQTNRGTTMNWPCPEYVSVTLTQPIKTKKRVLQLSTEN